MAKYSQSKASRMDESLGMRRGKESSKSQSYKSRRDESMGMKNSARMGKGERNFDLRDNTQAPSVRNVPTDAEKYDMNRIQYYSSGSKGYPSEAWNYEY